MIACSKTPMEEIHLRAQNLLYYNNLLLEQCDSWLSEEEGMKNMQKNITERYKAQRKTLIFKIWNVFFEDFRD